MERPISTSSTKAYLGDGAYIDVDGYGGLLLTTEDGISVQNSISLEPSAITAFLTYLKRESPGGDE